LKFEQLPLETERLLLRPLVPEDADALFGIFSDPVVVRWGSSPAWTEMKQADAFIQSAVDAQVAGTSLRLGIVRREDSRLIGQCTFYAVSDQNRRAELGYTLASDCWGRGYMNEALRALVNYGFRTLDMIRLEADIDPRNLASARALERLGFTYEGLMRDRWIVGDEISDTGFYGLLRRDWEKR
jgi:RimJ/RimL family protein N-acetyltransferase